MKINTRLKIAEERHDRYRANAYALQAAYDAAHQIAYAAERVVHHIKELDEATAILRRLERANKKENRK